MIQPYGALKNCLLFNIKRLRLLLFILSPLVGSEIVDDIYLYDASMFPKKGNYIVSSPEIKIRFNELGESFNTGDKIYIRLETLSDESQPLVWYYPDIHDKNVSLLKKIFRKIQNSKSNYRIKQFTLGGKKIPYPTIRIMSENILGNARSKVAPKLQFKNKDSTIQIDIENEMSSDDILRLKGLFFSVKNRNEAGPSILEYKKNMNGEWKRLGNEKFIIGQSQISTIEPNRFIRIWDKSYTFDLDIASGKYPTIVKDGNLIITLSKDIKANWVRVDKQKLILKYKNDRKIIGNYTTDPNVSDKKIILPIKFNIPPNSHLIIPLTIKSISGPIDPLSKGTISISTELTGHFDLGDLKKETRLGDVAAPIIMMAPKIKVEGTDLLFFLNSEENPQVTIGIAIENGSSFEKGDIVKIKIPNGVDLNWGEIPLQKQKGFRVKRNGNKIIEVKIIQSINEYIALDKIPFNKPSHSIPPFKLVSSFSFAPNTLSLPAEGEISFGQSNIGMAKSQLINRLADEMSLNDVIITEDDSVTTLKTGGIIEIIGNNEYFSFNLNRWADVVISGSRGNKKIGINYNKSTTDKIVFNIIQDFEKGEQVHVSNIPITNIQKTGNLSLNYNINNKSKFTDQNEIKIIDLVLDLADNLEFVKDEKNPNKSYGVNELRISIEGKGKLLNQGEQLILSLPEKMADWGRLDKISMSSSDLFSIKKRDSQHLVLTAKQDIYNAAKLIINNIPIVPTVNEFINQKLKLTTTIDTSVFDISNHSITYSYPSFYSLVDQVFFPNDTSWFLYNIKINTRNLDKTILPRSKIIIHLLDERVKWDTEYNTIEIKGEHADKLSRSISFNGQTCVMTAQDSIRADMSFEISGLRILPIKIPDIEFSLQLSLEEDMSISAIDKTLKMVKPKIDYISKINRSIDESSYGMKSRRSWKIIIPDASNYKWDMDYNQIRPVFFRKGMPPKGGFNPKNLLEKVQFINEKTVEISVINGYGSQIQGPLDLSGTSVTKIVFSGLKLKSLSNNNRNKPINYLSLSVETPYGAHVVQSHKSGEPDWGLKINGKKSIPLNQIAGNQLEIEISTPQVQRFGMGGVLSSRKLMLYSDEEKLLKIPLVENIDEKNETKVKNDLKIALEHIKKLYDDTDPKGKNWKVWYYLSFAKWQANELGILEEILGNKWIKDDRVLIRGSYMVDMEKAKNKGYQPNGRHKDYPLIEKGNLLAEINGIIQNAVKEYKNDNLIIAEKELISILAKIDKNEELSYRSAVVDYWLGRIALDLDDIEYDSFRASYPFRKYSDAIKTYKNNESLFSSEYWLEDSIRFYRDIAIQKVNTRKDRKENKLELITPVKEAPSLLNKNIFRFKYKKDNDYTYNIKGESDAQIGLINTLDTDLFLKNNKLSPGFNDEIRLGKGADYKIEFSPKKQSYYNIFTSLVVLILIGGIYGG